MKLHIENIGKIRQADLEFKGLTVIVGDNNTGKSTVGKVLATLFTVLPTIDERVKNARMDYVFDDAFVRYAYRFRAMDSTVFSQCFDNDTLVESAFCDQMTKAWIAANSWFNLDSSSDKVSDEDLANIKDAAHKAFSRLIECRKIPYGQLANAEVGKGFGRYFYGNVRSAGSESSCIRLTVSGQINEIIWSPLPECTLPVKLTHRGWFLGSPLLLNEMSSSGPFPPMDQERMHEPLLQRVRMVREVNSVAQAIVRDKVRPIESRLETILQGQMYYSQEEDELMIRGAGYKKPLSVKSLSMGLKAFAVLRWLLEKDVLREHDVLVLDEPENHLHPRWQLFYAELIVQLQECFGLTVLLTTHSPYFLESIQLFARKYQVADRLSVYQPECDADGFLAAVSDAVTDDAELYRRFTAPLRDLDVLRAELSVSQQGT